MNAPGQESVRAAKRASAASRWCAAGDWLHWLRKGSSSGQVPAGSATFAIFATQSTSARRTAELSSAPRFDPVSDAVRGVHGRERLIHPTSIVYCTEIGYTGLGWADRVAARDRCLLAVLPLQSSGHNPRVRAVQPSCPLHNAMLQSVIQSVVCMAVSG